MIEIHAASEAGQALTRAFASNPRMVRIDVRRDGVAVKVNEGMWSHTMGTGQRVVDGTIVKCGCAAGTHKPEAYCEYQ